MNSEGARWWRKPGNGSIFWMPSEFWGLNDDYSTREPSRAGIEWNRSGNRWHWAGTGGSRTSRHLTGTEPALSGTDPETAATARPPPPPPGGSVRSTAGPVTRRRGGDGPHEGCRHRPASVRVRKGLEQGWEGWEGGVSLYTSNSVRTCARTHA